jgi:SRSO17 transposase
MQDAVRHYIHAALNWHQALEELFDRMLPRFGRPEMQQRAHAYLEGLLKPVERKNGWQLAEAIGQPSPYSVQHLLDRAHWHADAVRDDLRSYVIDYLGQQDAVLVLDETGFLKKGTHSAGVQRQYSGTAGRIENCQIGVFMAYVSRLGHTLIDRELYLPREWAEDISRRRAAKIPDEIVFATKPQLAQSMLARAIATDIPFGWVTADEVYGNQRPLRVWLEQSERHYVMAVASNQYVWNHDLRQITVAKLAAKVAPEQWAMLWAGAGAKGPRCYDWVRIPLLSWQMPGQRWLLLRRSLSDANEVTYYVAYTPTDCTLQTMVQVAGTRWAIEECFESAKGEVGLDQYEVRSWHGWYRHITLAMAAHAYLAVLHAREVTRPAYKKKPRQSAMKYWKQLRLRASH